MYVKQSVTGILAAAALLAGTLAASAAPASAAPPPEPGCNGIENALTAQGPRRGGPNPKGQNPELFERFGAFSCTPPGL